MQTLCNTFQRQGIHVTQPDQLIAAPQPAVVLRHALKITTLYAVMSVNVIWVPCIERNKAFDPRRDLVDAAVDFKSDQIHLFWYEDALRNALVMNSPYVNIEYGYERGVQEVPTHNPLRMQHWREVLRRSWLITMGGGYINYYYCNTAWSLFIPEPIPPGYAAHQHLKEFWEQTRYWRLLPDNTPLGKDGGRGVYCRAEIGREYVVFDEDGAGFMLEIQNASTPLQARWFNPLGGEWIDAGTLSNGCHQMAPPWGKGNWAVLHVRAV